jgi:hypothetical protein
MSTHFRSEAIHTRANSSWFATDEGIMSGPSSNTFTIRVAGSPGFTT